MLDTVLYARDKWLKEGKLNYIMLKKYELNTIDI